MVDPFRGMFDEMCHLIKASQSFLTEPQGLNALSCNGTSLLLIRQHLNKWSQALDKPLIVILDDIDLISQSTLSLMLSQIRDGFQFRPQHFPQSFIFIGQFDVGKKVKRTLQEDQPQSKVHTPFNIVAKSFDLLLFTKLEVRYLLDQHTEDTGQEFSDAVVEKIYEYAAGQPWLTNALANEIVAKMLRNDHSKTITPEMVIEAKERLIEQRQTHLDSLADKVREPRVREIVMSIIEGSPLQFDTLDDSIRYCRDLGLITQKSPIRFANPIYREIITRILNSPLQESFPEEISETAWYLDKQEYEGKAITVLWM